jgi:putative DNA primase/helicase
MSGRYIDVAPDLLDRGWNPVPLPEACKASPPAGFTGRQGRPVTHQDIARWQASYPVHDKRTDTVRQVPSVNVAVRLPADVVGVDVDDYGTKNGGAQLAQLVANLGPLPATWSSTSRGEGASRIMFYRIPEGVEFPGEVEGGSIDFIQHGHRYAVVCPSMHPDGRRYQWFTPDGITTDDAPAVDDLPDLPATWVEHFDKATPTTATTQNFGLGGTASASAIPLTANDPFTLATTPRVLRDPESCHAVEKVVDTYQAAEEKGRHPAMLKAVCALERLEQLGYPGVNRAREEVRASFIRSVTNGTEHVRTPQAADDEWDDAVRGAPAVVAREPSTRPRWDDLVADETRSYDRVSTDDPPLASSYERVTFAGQDGIRYTDAGNAQRLIAKRGEHIRFVPKWGQWMCYRSGRWQLDHAETMVSYLAKELGRDILSWKNIHAINKISDGTDRKDAMTALIGWGRRSENRTGIEGTIAAAATEPGIAIDHEAIEAQPWLLNVKNGTVNLATGELLPHSPMDLLMYQASVNYDPTATAPEWDTFLARVLPDDEVRRFVQRLFGLTLVGEQIEHVLPIALGGGANGKSTLTKIIATILGEYAVVCSKDILLALKHSGHPTAKATLFRRRLAHSGELPASAELDEAQVKELTGGDRITARRMRQDEWTFEPSHMLWLHANHRPRIGGTDDGIWRRVKLIPFDVQIPEDERDPKLANRIIANESSGVLMWMLKGLADYQRNGLATPEGVKAATNGYRHESDTVAMFLEECGIVIGPTLTTTTADLLQLHEEWFADSGIGDKEKDHYQRLIQALKARGVTSGRTSSRGRFWKGVGRGGDNG